MNESVTDGFSYSGRGMFGRTCLAFKSLDTFARAILENSDLPESGWEFDNFGLGIVIYNKRVPFTGTPINKE